LIALKLVIEQGEGAIEGVGGGAKSHYEIFKELRDDNVKHPLNCSHVVENPKTAEFETKAPKIHKVNFYSPFLIQNQSTDKIPKVMVFSDAVVRVSNKNKKFTNINGCISIHTCY